MDPRRFDDLARAVAARSSRRRLLGGIGGGLVALFAASRRDPTDAATPPAGATPAAHATIAAPATYVSPSYQYTLTYDPAVWTPVPNVGTVNQGPTHLDRFRLEHGGCQVTFDAYQDGRGDPAACVHDQFAALASQPGAGSATPIADNKNGQPVAGTTADGGVYAAQTLTMRDQNSAAKPMTAYVECRRLITGSKALLAVTELVAAADYAGMERSVQALLGGLDLGDGPVGSQCTDGQTSCGGGCVDTETDAANCGKCGTSCATGQVCQNGACAAPNNGCPSGQTPCFGVCVDLATDNANCGLCGRVCVSGAACAGGGCDCLAGLAYCAGASACVNLATDPLNCGACGNACRSGVCGGGACTQPTCAQQGLTACAGACVDLSADAANCGSCGNTCTSGTCQGGSCAAASCRAQGLTRCGGGCVDLSSDVANCGDCGNACPAGQRCVGGACQAGS